MPFHAVR